MKYLCTVNVFGQEELFIFPEFISHIDISRLIINLPTPKRIPISAGYINNGVCHGRSKSLNLKARSEDDLLLKIVFY